MIRCPWVKPQIRSAHGATTGYNRKCMWGIGHIGPHEVPPRAKQTSDGVWYNPETGQTLTQHQDEVELW